MNEEFLKIVLFSVSIILIVSANSLRKKRMLIEVELENQREGEV